MRTHSFLALSPTGFHRIAYVEWGPHGAPRTVICVHGLTRNARDFDRLADTMAGDGWRVVCPDMAGRGGSDRLANPMAYLPPQYAADCASLIARLDVPTVDWVGTSMGGIVGMILAAQPQSPIRRLVVNDVGGMVPQAAIARMQDYVGRDPTFDDLADAQAHLRRRHQGFSDLSDADWAELTRHSVRQEADGRWSLVYDPAIGEPIRAQPATDQALWALWDRITCPVLVIRGELSNLLLEETLQEMLARKPGTEVFRVPGVGHAPSLRTPEQIAAIRRFLEVE